MNRGYQENQGHWPPQSNDGQWQSQSDHGQWSLGTPNFEHQSTTYEYNNGQEMEISMTTGSSGQDNPDLSCVLCKITLRSPQVAEAHYGGKKHKKMMEKQGFGNEDKPKQDVLEINCEICTITLRSQAQADAHFEGKKHKTNVAKKEGDTLVEVRCVICNLTMPSEVVAKAHYEGKKHRINVAKKESGEKINGHQMCEICNLTLRTQDQANAHFEGKKHKTNVARKEKGQTTTMSPCKIWDTAKANFPCKLCNVTVLEKDAKEHYEGKDHKNNVSKLVTAEQTTVDIKCDICDVKMISQVWADAHFGGSMHKLNLAKRKAVGNCELCSRIFFSEEQIKSHHEGKKHLEMVEKKEKQATIVLVNCDICNITLRSQPHADAHFEGKKHKLNVAKKEALEKNPPKQIPCEVCKITLTSDQKAKDHFEGKKHKSNVAKQETVEEETQCEICSITLRNKTMATAHYEGKKHQSAVEKKAKKENQVEIKCDICARTLVSQEQATAHFEGKKHKAQVARMELGDDDKVKVPCEVCDITLPSKSKAQAHFEGNRHKINVAKKEAGEEIIKEQLIPCDICNIILRSQFLANSHFAGKKHKNNLAKKEGGDRNEEVNCEVCDVTLQKGQTTAHFEGKRHQINLSKKDGTAVNPNGDKSLIKKSLVICKSMDDIELQLAQATAMDSDGDIPMDEDAWMQDRELMCGLCLVKLGSKVAAAEHFSQPKHVKREKLQSDGDTTKWCPVCLVELNSPPTATIHYNGRQHKAKIELAKKLGSIDSDVLSELQPTNAVRAAMMAQLNPIKASGVKRIRVASRDTDEPAAKKSPTSPEEPVKLQEGVFNCLFCNITVESKRVDEHRSSQGHLDSVQRAADLQASNASATFAK